MMSKLEAGQRMVTYIGSVRAIRFQLQQLGVTVTDEDTILVLTLGLPRIFNAFVVALDSTSAEQFTLEYVIQRLLNEESRINLDVAAAKPKPAAVTQPGYAYSVTPDTATRRAVTSQGNGLARITCFTCGAKGHYQYNCPQKKSPNLADFAASVEEAAILDSDDSDGIW